MSTPHNEAKDNQIAKTVLMPGDPLRAKYIADNYLENSICFNTVRNMFGYTGTYNGRKISVMGSGMGMPSIGLYSYELYNMYNVDNIIRIGSAGSISKNVKLRDIVVAMGACTDSNYASQYNLGGTFAPIADYELLRKAVNTAEKERFEVHVGNVLSSDTFYTEDPQYNHNWAKLNVMAVEMEAAALYMNAARTGKKALCLLTISDHLVFNESLDAMERQSSFDDMIKLALQAFSE